MDELQFLKGELEHEATKLRARASKAAAMHNATEYSRIDGKREGIEAALMLVQQSIRYVTAKAIEGLPAKS